MPLGKELRHGLVLGKLQLNGSSTKRDLGQQGHYHSRKAFIDCGDQIQQKHHVVLTEEMKYHVKIDNNGGLQGLLLHGPLQQYDLISNYCPLTHSASDTSALCSPNMLACSYCVFVLALATAWKVPFSSPHFLQVCSNIIF